MNIHCPSPEQTAQLRRLWKTAFPDDDAYLDKFFSIAYSPTRCRCLSEGGEIAAALYWFHVSCAGKNLAYLYAVATDPAHRNQGLCRRLMEDTGRYLKNTGFQGLLLVPENEGLARMYEKMGFERCSSVAEFPCAAGSAPLPLRKVDASEYARLRRRFLPPNSVLQEGADLSLLASQADFLAGADFLAAVTPDGGTLRCQELLGSDGTAPGLLRALGYEQGFFRTPGNGRPFAWLRPLSADCPRPAYFGIALD